MNEKRKMLVSKSNPLLDMKNDMSLYQQRMFNLYLAKINPMDTESKNVRFTLGQFIKMVGITEVNVKKMRALAKESMQQCVDLYAIETDGSGKKHLTMKMNYVNVWRRFKVDKNETGEWVVELEAGEDVLPYMFQIRELGYLNFSVYHALRIRSPIEEKLYEQCCRFRDKGVFSITPDQLKERLGISGKKSYESYNKLKTGVINRCLKDINDNTDIYVTIAKEERERRRGAPVRRIYFSVATNPNFKQEEADEYIKNLHDAEDEKRNTIEMAPIEMAADEQITLDQYILQQEFGLTDKEARAIIHDKEELQLTDERVREVIKYSLAQNPKSRIAYIRKMLKEDPNIPLKAAEKSPVNRFNQFEQQEYDFDELEKSLQSDALVSEEEEPEKLPPYYVVIGDENVAKRLAAYAALGIEGKDIKILSEEEYNRMKKE